MNDLAISVVLATRNRAESLRQLLSAMQSQRETPDFEIIVADNGSTDHTAEVVNQSWKGLSIRRVLEPVPGKGRALNAALRLAKGDLIVLTDDDVIPRPNWLAQLHEAAVAYPNHGVFGGRIEVALDSVPLWVQRSFNLMSLLTSAHDMGPAVQTYGYAAYPFGPNMAVRRALLNGLKAPYPEDMGPGTPYPVGDETGFFLPISPPAAQDRLFVPTAVVLHEVEHENVAFRSAVKRCFLAGMAHGRLGLPGVAQSAGYTGRQPSTAQLILQRIRSSRSFRELVCITTRYIGYLRGRRTGPLQNTRADKPVR